LPGDIKKPFLSRVNGQKKFNSLMLQEIIEEGEDDI
jgi:hypothetical protein